MIEYLNAIQEEIDLLKKISRKMCTLDTEHESPEVRKEFIELRSIANKRIELLNSCMCGKEEYE